MTTAQTPETNQAPPPQQVVTGALDSLPEDNLLRIPRAIVSSPRFIPIIDRSWFDFFCDRGRFPRLGDSPAPYTYSGWLLHQVMIMSEHPLIVPRWPYYLSMREAGCLTDAPIPQINFDCFPPEHSSPLKPLRKLIEKLGRFHGYGERALNCFIDWLAFALAVEREYPAHITDEVSEFLYRTFDVSGFLLFPWDYLGQLLEELRGSKKNSGFFLTPGPVCIFMSEMLMDRKVDHRAELFIEPACGSGRNMLTASNWTLRILGVDLDEVCCKVARINSALYAPWIAFPLPEDFFADIEAGTTIFQPDEETGHELLAQFETSELTPKEMTSEEETTAPAPDDGQQKRRKPSRTDTSQGSLFDFSN